MRISAIEASVLELRKDLTDLRAMLIGKKQHSAIDLGSDNIHIRLPEDEAIIVQRVKSIRRPPQIEGETENEKDAQIRNLTKKIEEWESRYGNGGSLCK